MRGALLFFRLRRGVIPERKLGARQPEWHGFIIRIVMLALSVPPHAAHGEIQRPDTVLAAVLPMERSHGVAQ